MNVAIALDPRHEAAVELACDLDRRYFAANPSAMSYRRPAIDHELCLPGGSCLAVVGRTVVVTAIAPGVRARAIAPRES